jgi:hypothetical protein
MANGEWSMVNGQWSMVNGEWSMVNREISERLYFSPTSPISLSHDILKTGCLLPMNYEL